MSAEVLRRAAALMRERAEGTQRVDAVTVPGWYTTEVLLGGDGASVFFAEDAEQIVSWHPAVALAVADWLDSEADSQHPHAWDAARMVNALAVARAYLGESA